MTFVVYASEDTMPSPVPILDWPDPLLLVRGWLLHNLTDVNVVTATSATFGTANATADQSCPLVLIESVPAGYTDVSTYSQTELVDVSCFGYGVDSRSAWGPARELSRQVHRLILRLPGVRTSYGTADEVTVTSTPGQLSYSNPNLVRFLGSYEITARSL